MTGSFEGGGIRKAFFILYCFAAILPALAVFPGFSDINIIKEGLFTLSVIILLIVSSALNPLPGINYYRPLSMVLIIYFVIIYPPYAFSSAGWRTGILSAALIAWAFISANISNKLGPDSIFTLFAFTALLLSVYGIIEMLGYSLAPEARTTFITRHYPVVATFGNPNFFAGYLASIAPMTVYLWISKPRSLLYPAALCLMLINLYFCRTGSALVALAVELMVIAALFLKKEHIINRRAALIKLAILILCLFLSIAMIKQVTPYKKAGGSLTEAYSPLKGRLYLYAVSSGIIKDNPLIGIGPGNLDKIWPVYQKNYLKKHPGSYNYYSEIDTSHNALLEQALNYGIPAAIIFFLIFILSFIRVLNAGRQGIFAAAALAGVFADWMLSSNYSIAPCSVVFFTLAGLALPGTAGQEGISRKTGAVLHKKYIWLPALFLLLMLAGYFYYGKAREDRLCLRFTEYIKAGSTGQALAASKELVKIMPRNPRYLYFRGLSLRMAGKPAGEVLPYLEESIKRGFYEGAYFEYASIMTSEGNHDKAALLYRQLLEYHPGRREALNNLANSLARAGKYEDALTIMKHTAFLYRDYEENNINLRTLKDFLKMTGDELDER